MMMEACGAVERVPQVWFGNIHGGICSNVSHGCCNDSINGGIGSGGDNTFDDSEEVAVVGG
jgi:hypothetical protein